MSKPAKTVTVYRANSSDIAPVPKTCAKPGYPNRTDDGETMYENTHFVAEADAWTRLIESSEAHIEAAARDVEYAREKLRQAEQRAADAVVRRKTVMEGYEAWKTINEKGTVSDGK